MPLRRALIIDDSDPDLLYTQIVLDRAHVAEQVITCGGGQEALDLLQRSEGQEVDLILLDINMPEMDGFEFLQAYQKLHTPRQVRAVVVMLTSSPDPADRARAESFPCVRGYVVKPIDTASALRLETVVDATDP
jgi:CheY-like chemotaxis protein